MKKKLIETYVFFIVAALVCVFLVDAYNSNRSGKSTIFNAAIYGQSDLIKEYVKQGKDMNSQDEYGATLLHYSLQSGHTGISKFLVISEADVNIMDKEELTPLDWAHWMNQVETAKLIREYGGKTGEELKAAEPVAKSEESPSSKKLTASEVTEIMAFNIGHWETNGEGMPVGGAKQAIKMRMEVRWKEKAESLEYKYTINQNGEDVSYFGHEEYDAAKGVFVYRSKWGENPETTSQASYNPASRTSYAQTATTKLGVKAKTVTTTKRVGKDKIHQNLRTFENGELVYTHDIISTRIEGNNP